MYIFQIEMKYNYVYYNENINIEDNVSYIRTNI